jgi:DNA helicase-2/ATP-dependent DNA helicase PcrA
MEEEMFPYRINDPDEIEEERRLAYVAFTRAREKLLLTHVFMRRMFGQVRIAMRSRFLDELPADDIEEIGESATPAMPQQNRWNDDPYGAFRSRPSSRNPNRVSWPSPPRSSTRMPAVPQRGQGSWVDTTDADSPGEEGVGLRRGMKVRHVKFGVGQVQSVDANTTPPRANVAFPGWGVKQVVVTYLEPA